MTMWNRAGPGRGWQASAGQDAENARTNVVGHPGVLELALLANLGLEVELVVHALLVQLNHLVVRAEQTHTHICMHTRREGVEGQPQTGRWFCRFLRGAVGVNLVKAGDALVGGVVRVLRVDGDRASAAKVTDHGLGCLKGGVVVVGRERS